MERLTNARRLKTAKIWFDVPEFVRASAGVSGLPAWLLYALQTTGQTAFYLDYEDLGSVEVDERPRGLLGVEAG